MPDAIERSLLESLPDAVISIDRASTIVFANRTALALFGFSREEFIGRPLAETIIPPELRAQHMRGMQRFQETGSGPVIGRRIDITAIDKSGRRFPIELSVFLDTDRPRELFHATIRETSDRVAREAVSTAERERLRQILDATADAWWEHSVGGATRYSDAAASVLGVGTAELPRCDPSSIPAIDAEDRGRVSESWRAHLAGEAARFECTVRLVRSDGSMRWIRLRGRSVEFDRGRPTRIVGTLADVSEQQSTDERLRNAQRLEMLGLLAGGFAHDLNNLLAAIRGHAALAATEHGVSPPAIESLAAIQLATTRARMLTSNMLSLGKPRSEAISRFPVGAAIEEAVEIARGSMPKTIAVSLDIGSAAGVAVELDPSAFQQLILNLLVNARDAMPSGGRLRIEAVPLASAEGGDQVRISVEDTGVGIPPEMIERILEPFFSTKPGGEGTGLGLAVVQRVVTSAGGRVDVSSDVGRGTRVTLLLPAHRVEGHAARVTTPNAIGVLLLVEPHEMLRPMLGETLRSIGHRVLECESATEAIRLAREHARGPKESRVSALVAEHGVASAPGSMSGPRLHAQLEMDLNTRLPAVFMCSDPSLPAIHDERSDVKSLQKPFEIVELVEAVSSVLSAR
jgi:two-component system, cell cycle sensor histidine kinase and response regulator CckA